MWQCPTLGTYITLESPQRVDICPSEDIKPHILFIGECPCRPQTSFHHDRMHVLHVRYSETEAVEKSMEKLFASEPINDPKK